MITAQIPTSGMRFKHLATQYSVIALVLMSVCPFRALAQGIHPQPQAMQHGQVASSSAGTPNALLQAVREATERFQNVSAAEAEGYALQFGCVTGDTEGAMGLHYINGDLVGGGVLDVAHPQIVIYEPLPSGRLKLIGADYLLFQAAWDSTHSAPPQLMGQAFHLFTSPNQFGLPAFYTLHVWAWKENPNGAFVNWHPNVSCQPFSNQAPDRSR